MGKYAEDAKELLRLVGGKENIAAVSHCMTRMRFVLNDPKKADIEKIEAMKAVKGSFTQAGQFQVIIGNTVADFYNDFIAVSGIEGVSKDAVKHAAKQNQNVLQRVIAALAEIFAPLIPAIITGGLILGFRNCIDSLYLFEDGTKTLCQISQFWAGIDSFLWLIGEAVFDMLPVGICWSVTKKMGTTQMLGIVLGLTLVSGQLLNAYAFYEADSIEEAGGALEKVKEEDLSGSTKTLYDDISAKVNEKYLATLYQEGYTAYSRGDYDQAIEKLRKVADMDESYQNGNAIYYLAQSYRRAEDMQQAAVYYQKVLDAYPGTERARVAQSYVNEYGGQGGQGQQGQSGQGQQGQQGWQGQSGQDQAGQQGEGQQDPNQAGQDEGQQDPNQAGQDAAQDPNQPAQ